MEMGDEAAAFRCPAFWHGTSWGSPSIISGSYPSKREWVIQVRVPAAFAPDSHRLPLPLLGISFSSFFFFFSIGEPITKIAAPEENVTRSPWCGMPRAAQPLPPPLSTCGAAAGIGVSMALTVCQNCSPWGLPRCHGRIRLESRFWRSSNNNSQSCQ